MADFERKPRNFCTILDGILKYNKDKKNVDTFIELVGRCCLSSLLSSLNKKRAYTVLVPSDRALASFKNKSEEEIKLLLKYHIIPVALSVEKIGAFKGDMFTMAGKGPIILRDGTTLSGQKGGKVTLKKSDEHKCKNGYFYIINSVLVPDLSLLNKPKSSDMSGGKKTSSRHNVDLFDKQGSMLRHYILKDYLTHVTPFSYPGEGKKVDGYELLNNNLEMYFNKRFNNTPFYSYILNTFFDGNSKDNINKVLELGKKKKPKDYVWSDELLQDFISSPFYMNNVHPIMSLLGSDGNLVKSLVSMDSGIINNSLITTYKTLYPVEKYPVAKMGNYFFNLLDDLNKYYKMNYQTIIPKSFKMNVNIQQELFLEATHKQILSSYFNNNKLTPKMKVMGLLTPEDVLFQEFVSSNQMPLTLSPFTNPKVIKDFIASQCFLESNFGSYQQNVLDLTVKVSKMKEKQEKKTGGMIGELGPQGSFSKIRHDNFNTLNSKQKLHWSLLYNTPELIKQITRDFRNKWPDTYYEELNNRFERYFGEKYKTISDYTNVMRTLFGEKKVNLEIIPVNVLKGFVSSKHYPVLDSVNVVNTVDVKFSELKGGRKEVPMIDFKIYDGFDIKNSLHGGVDMYLKRRLKFIKNLDMLYGSSLLQSLPRFYKSIVKENKKVPKKHRSKLASLYLLNDFNGFIQKNLLDSEYPELYPTFYNQFIHAQNPEFSVANILEPGVFDEQLISEFTKSPAFGEFSVKLNNPSETKITLNA